MKRIANVQVRPEGARTTLNWIAYNEKSGELFLLDQHGQCWKYSLDGGLLTTCEVPRMSESQDELKKPVTTSEAISSTIVSLDDLEVIGEEQEKIVTKPMSIDDRLGRYKALADQINARNKLKRMGLSENEVSELTPLELNLITTLASHQVSGDKIQKGLRAKGIVVDIKVEENFLGGWMFTKGDEVYSASAFIEAVNDAATK